MTAHGTVAGYHAHRRKGETVCEECRLAHRGYDRERRDSGERLARNRLFAKAQRLAYQELASRFPDEYRAEYERAKADLGIGEGAA